MVAPWLAEQGLGWVALVLPIVGMVVLVAANIDNITGTWAGRWGSSLASWTIWAALGWVGFAAQLQLGATVGAMLLAPVAAVSTAVAVGALRARRFAPPPDEVSWQRTVDIVCAIGAALALAALVTSTGRQALLLTIVTDAIAAIPTYTAAYREPDSLPTAPFTAGAASAVLTLAAAPSWGFDDAGYAVYLYVMCRGLVWLIRWRRAAQGGRARRAGVVAPARPHDVAQQAAGDHAGLAAVGHHRRDTGRRHTAGLGRGERPAPDARHGAGHRRPRDLAGAGGLITASGCASRR